MRMQLASVVLLQPLSEYLNHRQKRLLILDHENHIIHETAIVQTKFIKDIMVEVIEVVVHRVLPDQMADSTAYSVWLFELGFIIRNILPFP